MNNNSSEDIKSEITALWDEVENIKATITKDNKKSNENDELSPKVKKTLSFVVIVVVVFLVIKVLEHWFVKKDS